MQEFVPGQRWISEAEIQMGLGTILSCDERSVTLLFMSTGETRIYARRTAPLSRVRFEPGDKVKSHEGWTLTIQSVHEADALLLYKGVRDDGSAAELTEGQLDNFMQLNRPGERLFNSQVDKDKHFDLRYLSRLHQARLARSDLRGLCGARTSLIPHQLYIAHEVANRFAPRVLLADEVGLGKTIEAGLILHHQLQTERAQRVLIVVPSSLVHQWLVEMLRRFNLHFSIFDEERCQAIQASSGQDNPFAAEQLALCSLDFLREHPERHRQATEAGWDLLIVDEAHHLQWSPEDVSLEYQLIEQLAAVTAGVLLLTATPEQLGKQSHFARLRLLDPDRFPDYARFLEEEQHYQPVAQAVEELLAGAALGAEARQTLVATINEGDNQALLDQIDSPDTDSRQRARTELVEHLLDRHGTGRILYRNTRAAVQGFPGRHVVAHPLPLPAAYGESLAALDQSTLSSPQLLLSPELVYQASELPGQTDWTLIDPRVQWLADQLKQLRPHKVLVIAHNADTAIELATALRIKEGIHAAVFHEEMSIVERDRAAAFFADFQDGAQVLICSEIGSEGRNFQFAHHLVMFDLPLNPDLLEQRIGRLDRIGQTQTIQIHVPYLEQSAQEVMFHWYHQGLAAFEHTCPAGHNVFVEVQGLLDDALHQRATDSSELMALIATSQKLNSRLNQALHEGRDRLLEYNSCRPGRAAELQQRARQADDEKFLWPYLEKVFDCYGVDSEEHGEHSYILRPGDRMQTQFPGLLDDGMTVTYDRNTALSNEDMHYLTWEHPMVADAMDMVLSSELGNTALNTVKYRGVKAGTLLLECIYVVESSGQHSSRYLPPTPVRLVVDPQGADHSEKLSNSAIQQSRELVDKTTVGKIVRAYNQQLRDMVKLGDALAASKAPAILAKAQQQAEQTLSREINRLKALQQHNPNVRDAEIAFFEAELQQLAQTLESAAPRLDAIRVIVVT